MTTLKLDSLLRPALTRPLTAAIAGPAHAAAGTARRGDTIALGVRQALAAAQSGRPGLERRREARYPYPYPVYLTPVIDDVPAAERTIVVIGKHLSEHGLDFYHREPLADRQVIASLDGGAAGWVGMLLELTWCRFSRHGWYDNGGRFVSLVLSPLDAEASDTAAAPACGDRAWSP